jgi:hypothetical protein
LELIIRQKLANSAAERWKDQYQNEFGFWMNVFDGDSEEIYKELVAHGPTPNPDDVDRITGNTSWTTIGCDNCHEFVKEAVVGDIIICKDCLEKAYGLIRSGN